MKWCFEGIAEYLLTANMQGGSSLFKFQNACSSNGEEMAVESVQTFSNGCSEQLIYGACQLGKGLLPSKRLQQTSNFTFASCSFYENKLEIWSTEI